MSLIKSTAELKTFAPQFSKNMSWETLKPLVELCEVTYIIPVIGQDFFTELDDIYNAETPSPSAQQSAIIKKLQSAIAYYTVYESAKNINSSITDSGLMESMPEKAGPARQWNYNMTLQSSITTADRLFDIALKFLEDNKGDYSTWTESPEFTVSKELFINSTTEISQFINIGNSRRAFLQIRPYIKTAEEKYIIPTIGEEFYQELKDKIKDDELSDDDIILIDKYIKKPLAFYSFYEAAPNMVVEVKGSGINVLSSSDGITQSKDANDKQLTYLLKTNLDNGNSFLARLKAFIEKNASDYPTYYNNSGYQNKQLNSSIPDNTGSKSFFT